jgi:hypothetical protein
MYRKLDAGSTTNWVEVGAGTGGKNYIKNPDFDGGATTSWSMQKVSLSSFIPTGNIGAADAGHTIATSSSSPLEGANSLLVQGASAFTAGNCLVSEAFTIDREDVAKVMGWSFSYEAITTNMDFSGTTANTWAVYIAEVTTATPNTVVSWIQPAGVYNLTQGVGVGLAAGTFQTTATTTSAYRLVLVCINSEAAATTLKVDDFQLGPQKVVYGSPITDWQPFTPTVNVFSGTLPTFSSRTGEYRRVGDTIEVKATITWQTAATFTDMSLNLPFGTTDESKLPSGPGNHQLGSAVFTDAGIRSYAGGVIHGIGASTDRVQFYPYSTNTSDASSANDPSYFSSLTQNYPFTFASGDFVSLEFSYPATGLSSSVQMSNDTDTRVVAARATKTSLVGTQTIAATTGPSTIVFDIAVIDTHGSYSPVTNSYTFPVSGIYKITSKIIVSASVASSGFVRISANGTHDFPFSISSAGIETVDSSVIVSAIAGQTALVSVRNDTGSSISILSTASISGGSTISVERLSGPATIAANETVAARYGLNAATNITNGVVINYAQKDYDYTNSVTTGASWRFTAPISGLYEVSVLFYAGPATSGTINQEVGVRLAKNGVAAQYIYIDPAKTTSSVLKIGNGSTKIKLLAGEYIEIFGYNATGITHTAAADPNLNYVEITRIGN